MNTIETPPVPVILSHSTDQDYILRSIADLHCEGRFHCDATYGFGGFYRNMEPPELKFDITPQVEGVVAADSAALPVDNNSVRSIVFDPPFLTYVKNGREHGSIMAKRFGGYWTYGELEDHYIGSLFEFYRKLVPGGVLVVKCQDIVHNHRLHCTHANVLRWAESAGFRLKDLFVLSAKHRMPANRSKSQHHARIAHSFFLVFVKK